MEMAVTRYIYKGIFRRELTCSNPIDRGKLGTKRHVLTDGQGISLSVGRLKIYAAASIIEIPTKSKSS